ncbi:MAG: DUF1801 domain-containing protein [Pseudomonadota bacterium]
MQSSATTVEAYIAELPEERRAAVEAVRKVILDNLDGDYVEGMGYGMIGYSVPHSRYPAGYHCNPKMPLPFAAIASQKNYVSVYLMGLYVGCIGDEESGDVQWFREAWAASGKKKLDMGKSCVRFKKLDDVALDVIGESIKRIPAQRYIERYEEVLASSKSYGKKKA